MKTFKLFEPQPLKLKPPKEEPVLRVGIILECDKKRQVFFTPQNDSEISDSTNQITLIANSRYSLENTTGNKLLLKDEAGDSLQTFSDKVILVSKNEVVPAPQAGVRIENIVAGRGFHWQKEIPETFIGKLEFIASEDVIVVVNVIGIEFYSICALASEMSGVNSLPASGQAQATAARSWAYVFLGSKYTDKPYQICNDDLSQRYQGTTHLSQNIIDMALETRGDYLVLSDGTVSPSYYSKSCGGYVESTDNLFSTGYVDTCWDCEKENVKSFDLSKDEIFRDWLFNSKEEREKYFCGCIPDNELKKYLGAVDDKGEYFRWEYTVSSETIIKKLRERCQIDEAVSIKDIKMGRRGKSGRYLSMELTYISSSGSEETILLADQFYIRAILHESFLLSSAFVFDILRDGKGNIDSIHFNGAGWGHGGGFCQIGAVGMALAGHSYQEILNHYYPDTKIIKAY